MVSFVIIYIENDMMKRMVCSVFFLGFLCRNFGSGLICSPKSLKKPFKNPDKLF